MKKDDREKLRRYVCRRKKTGELLEERLASLVELKEEPEILTKLEKLRIEI